jgi:hypothetical protein
MIMVVPPAAAAEVPVKKSSDATVPLQTHIWRRRNRRNTRAVRLVHSRSMLCEKERRGKMPPAAPRPPESPPPPTLAAGGNEVRKPNRMVEKK